MNEQIHTVPTDKVISAGLWAAGIRVAQRGFSLARLLVLATFLAPYDFGLMGIALLVIASIDTFSQTGFQQALVQKKGDIEPYLSATWTFTVLRGIALFCLIVGVAPFATDVFDTPEAALVIRVTALSMLLQSATNTGVIYFQKELDFSKQFTYNIGGILADFAVSVGSVLILHNVWALVLGLLAGNVVRLAMSYALHPFRPRFDPDVAKARELFRFGKWILGSTILAFLVTQGDSILIGFLLGATALGLYQLAMVIASTPTTEIAHVIGQVAFPAFAKLQDRMDAIRTGYLKTLKISTYFSFGLACFIIVLIDEFIYAFMNPQWAGIVAPVQVLVIAGAIRSLAATSGSVFVAVGKPKTDTYWQVLRLVVLLGLLYPLIVEWGIVGAAFAVLASISASSIGFCWSVIRMTECGFTTFLRELLTPVLAALTAGIAMYGTNLLLTSTPLVEFFAVTIVGVLALLSATMILDRLTGSTIMPLIKSLLTPIRRRCLL